MKTISVAKLPELFSAIAEEMALYLPADHAGKVAFLRYGEGVTPALDALNSSKSPKDLFFPQSENLMAFKRDGKKIEIIDTREEEKPFAVFGIRACDLQALHVLDRVFLADPVDTYYQQRRQNGVLIAAACVSPEEHCFCGSFGIDAASPAGDIVTYTVDDKVYWQPITEKGKDLTDRLPSSLLTEDTVGDTAVEQVKTHIHETFAKLPLSGLQPPHYDHDTQKNAFDHEIWGKLSAACLGCGTCTFVCPTCQCYDIRDYDTGHGIQRFRCWDSCMYSDFTKMAGGNPRLTQLERFRQRFMHKLVYFPINNEGVYSCVGCGRCVDQCPVSLNIVKVMKALGGGKGNE